MNDVVYQTYVIGATYIYSDMEKLIIIDFDHLVCGRFIFESETLTSSKVNKSITIVTGENEELSELRDLIIETKGKENLNTYTAYCPIVRLTETDRLIVTDKIYIILSEKDFKVDSPKVDYYTRHLSTHALKFRVDMSYNSRVRYIKSLLTNRNNKKVKQ